MDELKSNSFKSKEREASQTEKKIEKVITNSATTKKKSGVQKLANVFISEDVDSVKSYIFTDVLIPAVKELISETVINGVNMILYGESGYAKKNSTSASKVSYRAFYEKDNNRNKKYISSSRGFDYDDVLFTTRGDAEDVLDAMYDIINQYGVVSIGDMYDLANVNTSNFNVNKYGWSDIQGSKVVRVREGYVLRLPKPMPLN